jgi:hypothetical protein
MFVISHKALSQLESFVYMYVTVYTCRSRTASPEKDIGIEGQKRADWEAQMESLKMRNLCISYHAFS